MGSTMDNIIDFKADLNKVLSDETEKLVISNPISKDEKYRKVDIRKVLLKGREAYQISSYTDKQVFQTNVDRIMLGGRIAELFPLKYSQLNIFNQSCEVSYKLTKKGKLLKNVNGSHRTAKVSKEHNRSKNYILKEGTVIPPLVDMGIFTHEGRIVAKMYDKFKQINRFIEMVDDVLKDCGKEEIHIIDFGCGKSYLTFIVYYYLTEIKHMRAYITGLDLKEDVIKNATPLHKNIIMTISNSGLGI